MTSREEIERLLNQTDRTLDGVPKVEIGYGARTNGKTMSIIKHQSDVIELLVGALRDALDERNYAVLRLCEQDGCEGCKHEECPHEDEPCVSCCRMWQYEEDDNWEFGILGKKVEAEW